MQAAAAQVEADYNTAKLQADRDAALAKENLLPSVDAEDFDRQGRPVGGTPASSKSSRLATYGDQEKAQLEAQKVKVDQLRADYNLKKSQVDMLKVSAGFDGTLQALPPPLAQVEEGQKVAAGAPLGKMAQPSHLKAELKIAETQVRDIAHRAAGGHRHAPGRRRIERADRRPRVPYRPLDSERHRHGGCGAQRRAAAGARPDLSVDGTIQLEKLDDVVYRRAAGIRAAGQHGAAFQGRSGWQVRQRR